MDKIINHVTCRSASVLTISMEKLVSQAAKQMRDNKLSALVVVNGKENWGIITETDLSRKIIADDLDPKKTKVKFVMSKPIVTIDSQLTMISAFVKMGDNGIRNIAVSKEDKIIGILTVKDFVTYYTEKYGPKK